MDVGRSISFPFRDPRWPVRVIVGALLDLLPLVFALPFLAAIVAGRHHAVPRLGPLAALVLVALLTRFIVIGYLRRVARGALDGSDAGLPAWDSFGGDLVSGFRLWLLTLGLWLPALAVTGGAAVLVAVAVSPSLTWVPLLLIGAPLALITLFYLPACLVTAIAEDDLAAAFDFARVSRRVGRALGAYLLAFLLTVAVLIIAQLGVLILCVGIFATRFLARCVAVHAFARAFSEGEAGRPAVPQARTGPEGAAT